MADENLILVVATASGFYAGVAREPGDKFRVPKKKSKASWFTAVETEAKGPKSVRKRDQQEAPTEEPEGEVVGGQPSEDLV